MKEKMKQHTICSEVKFEENKIVSFEKNNRVCYSFRVLRDNVLGIHYQVGEMSDEVGFAKAEENLVFRRPYPYTLETGSRKRDKTERNYTDKELLSIATEALAHIH